MTIQIDGTSGISGVDGSATTPALQGTDTNTGVTFGTDTVGVVTDGATRTTVDSSGRLLIGETSSTQAGSIDAKAQVVSSDFNAALTVRRNQTGDGAPGMLFCKSRGTSNSANVVVSSGDGLGNIRFFGADATGGNDFAEGGAISCVVDGTPGSNDMPGRLEFKTTSDGSDGPTTRMTINNAGKVTLNTTTTTQALVIDNSSTSIATRLLDVEATRAAHADYTFFAGLSGDGNDVEHRLRGDGNALCDGSFTGGGADYAEFFEWSDSNADAEDRRGISVVLDGDKIREAVAGEDPIGVISGNPSVVGDGAWNKWNGKYLRDDFGTYVQEDYEVEDDDGNTVVQQRRKLNPDYDPDQEYISREQRPEWDCVGLMGKLRIRKGQVTGARWIKMRDISDTVEEWLVR